MAPRKSTARTQSNVVQAPADESAVLEEGWDDSVLEYMHLKTRAFVPASDFPAHPDIEKDLAIACNEIKNRPTEELVLGAAGGIAEDMLNLAVRKFTGGGTKKDVQGAYQLLMTLVDKRLPGRPARVPRSVEARANSVLAWVEVEDALKEMPNMNIDALARAAMFANDAAALGLVSPAVLWTAGRCSDFGLRNRESWTWDHPYMPEFGQMDFMWEAWDRRVAEVELERQKQDKKVSKKPTSYCCAAPGCGIIATKKAALLKCSGGCPPEFKAHYCSKECQNADWKRHKPLCRPKKGDETSTPAQESTPVRPAPADSNDSVFDDPSDGKERSIIVDAPGMPGGKLVVSSTTMGPAALKSLREAAAKMSHS